MTPDVIMRLAAVVAALFLARLTVRVVMAIPGHDSDGAGCLALVLAVAAAGCLLLAFAGGAP